MTAPPPGVAPLAAGDRDRAAHVLARAFRDNPLNVAVIGDAAPERRVRANLHSIRALLPVACCHGRVLGAQRDGRLAGVLIATLPNLHPLPPPSLGASLRSLVGQGLRVSRRWREVFDTLSALHPVAPHHYLGTLGVDPPLQRRGLGSALLAAWLAEVDRDRCCAYLETDLPENVAFYESAGFDVEGEVAILGARVWRMRRPAPAFSPTANGY